LNTFIRHVGQYKTEKDTTDTYNDYNNIITCTWSIWNNTKNSNKKRATASAKYEVQQDNVHTI